MQTHRLARAHAHFTQNDNRIPDIYIFQLLFPSEREKKASFSLAY